MKKPTLYIMCGLAFSGKTTLAKSIAEYFQAEHISFDNIHVVVFNYDETVRNFLFKITDP